LAQSDVVLVLLEKSTAKRVVTNVFAVSPPLMASALEAPVGNDFFIRQISEPPPPTDLVISLHHFLI
jgi:hypothetical protein